jgi:hypothetical protein
VSHPPLETGSVQFDQQRAQAAVDALIAAARLLQQHTTTDLANARAALDGWSGHHADTFTSGDLPWVQKESARIVDGLLRLAATISGAATDAKNLQRQMEKGDSGGGGTPVARGRAVPI